MSSGSGYNAPPPAHIPASNTSYGGTGGGGSQANVGYSTMPQPPPPTSSAG